MISDSNSNRNLIPVLVLIACLAGIASDIYAPSIPAIAFDLNVPIDSIQWSMALYMLGLSLSQLVYGPLSDGFGRRPVLTAGLLIHLTGTVICYFAPSAQILILGRLIQGSGAGSCAALWRSIFRDLFSGEELAKYGSYLGMIMVFVVPAAPAIGGYLQECFDWRASFLFLVLYGLLTLGAVRFCFPETGKYHLSTRLTPSFVLNTYGQLLKNRVFAGYSLCVFLTYGAFFSWFAVGPVLLIDRLGYSPVEFGWISFGALCGAMVGGGFLNARLISRYGLYAMLRFGWTLAFASGAFMLFLYPFTGVNAYFIVGPVLIFYLGSTFIFANTFAGAFGKVGKIAGFAGALYGALQIGGASAIGAIVSYLPDNNQIPLACVYMGCSAASWAIYKLVIRPAE